MGCYTHRKRIFCQYAPGDTAVGAEFVSEDLIGIDAKRFFDKRENCIDVRSCVTIAQPRKSFYSGGLALDIEIGGFRPTTQDLDVERMMRVAGRREI